MSIGLKELRAYRVICAEIIQREEKLKKDKYHVVDAVQTAAEFPYWKHTVGIEGDLYPYPVEPERRKIQELRDEKARIERYVANVPDYRIRRAMEVCFLEPCATRITWEMVADAINDGSTGNGIKQMVWQYCNGGKNK